MTAPAVHILCRLALHDWEYSWRRCRGRRVIILFRACRQCGARQKWRIDVEKPGLPEWVAVNVA